MKSFKTVLTVGQIFSESIYFVLMREQKMHLIFVFLTAKQGKSYVALSESLCRGLGICGTMSSGRL